MTTRLVQRAYKFALDPTPAQAREFASHAGGARAAYNWGVAAYATALDARKAQQDAGQLPTIPLPGHFDLCKLWTANKTIHQHTPDERGRTYDWVDRNFVGTYQAALRDAAGAWSKMWDSRTGRRAGRVVGRPRFKAKGKSRDSFQVHGDSLQLGGVKDRSCSSLSPAPRKRMSKAARAKLSDTARARLLGHLLTWSKATDDQPAQARSGVVDARYVISDTGTGWALLLVAGHTTADLGTHRSRAAAQKAAQEHEDAIRHAPPDPVAEAKAIKGAHEAVDEARRREMAHLYGPLASEPGTRYIQLPKISLVRIPGKVRVGEWSDRNGRVARGLARLLNKAATTGLVACPACDGDGQVLVVKAAALKEGVTDPQPTKCTGCNGDGKVQTARIVRATISRGASDTWWCSVTAELVVDIPVTDADCRGCGGNGYRTNRDEQLMRCQDCKGRRTADAPMPNRRQRDNGAVGVDLGTMYLAVTSNADRYENGRLLDTALGELKAANRALSRTQPGSKRREKARRRLGTLHEQVALMRHYATNKITTGLVREYARIGVEGWDAQRLAQHGSSDLPERRRKDRNRSLADAAPGMIRNQLALKSQTSGCLLVKTGADDPTGRTCSRCGWAKTKPIPPAEYMFACEKCGLKMDRRVNTARVLRGRAEESTTRPAVVAKPRGEDVRPDTPRKGSGRQSSMKRAARSRQRGKTGTPDP